MAVRELVELVARVTDLERRVSGLLRHGRVAEIDMDMFRIRLDLGPAHGTGGRFLSPWLPYAQHAGALRIHTPPEIGQQFTIVSPTGDFQQAVAVPLHWSSTVPAPSDRKDENVLTYGAVRIEVRSDEVVFRVDGTTVTFNGSGVQIDGRLHVKETIKANGDIQGAKVGPVGPASASTVPGPGGTGSDRVPAPVPGTQ
jgi:phage baseplate assembly protein gpV